MRFAMTPSYQASVILFALLTWLPHRAFAAPTDAGVDISTNSDSGSACQTLSNKFPGKVSYPNTTTYTYQNSLYWDMKCVLHPYCIFTPTSTPDVAQAISILVGTSTQFAVRGGGHMPFPGAANTDQGVLISMSNFTTLQVNPSKSTVTVGAGLRWADVYAGLKPYNLMAIGGRYSPVGVPGLIVGGGISHFSSQRGWVANQVRSYEFVSADGKVFRVSADSKYADLNWALKGGSSNYGIVTNFELNTFKRNDVWAGTLSTTDIDGLLKALGDYVTTSTPGDGIQDALSAIDVYLLYVPANNTVGGSAVLVHNSTEKNPPSLRNFTALPTSVDTAHVRDYSDFQTETAVFGDRSLRESFYTTSFKADPAAIKIVYDTVTKNAPQLKNVANLLLAPIFQPVSTEWLQAAKQYGGDALDLDAKKGNFVILDISCHWSNPADDALIASWTLKVLQDIDRQTKAIGLYYPFIFLNDAGPEQSPFPTYGYGKSLSKMRSIRKKYDPAGVFQVLNPGGFRLGK